MSVIDGKVVKALKSRAEGSVPIHIKHIRHNTNTATGKEMWFFVGTEDKKGTGKELTVIAGKEKAMKYKKDFPKTKIEKTTTDKEAKVRKSCKEKYDDCKAKEKPVGKRGRPSTGGAKKVTGPKYVSKGLLTVEVIEKILAGKGSDASKEKKLLELVNKVAADRMEQEGHDFKLSPIKTLAPKKSPAKKLPAKKSTKSPVKKSSKKVVKSPTKKTTGKGKKAKAEESESSEEESYANSDESSENSSESEVFESESESESEEDVKPPPKKGRGKK